MEVSFHIEIRLNITSIFGKIKRENSAAVMDSVIIQLLYCLQKSVVI